MVSVVIPTYNRPKKTSKAIQSALDQSYTQVEVIVVDDHSKDNTKDKLTKTFGEKIKYRRNRKNRGASYCRNLGVSISSGRYIAFLDSDDLWHARKIERQMKVMKQKNSSLCYTGESVYGSQSTDERKNLLNKRYPEHNGRVFSELIYRDFIGACSRVLITKESFLNAGRFDESLSAREDWDLWLRIAKKGHVSSVEEILVERYVGGEGLSREISRVITSTKKVVDKHSRYVSKNKKLLSRHLSDLAKLQMQEDRREGILMAFASLLLNFRQPKLIASSIISLFGTYIYRKVYSVMKHMSGHSDGQF
nr:glycosyltransferase family A protein [Salinibacter ruber]